MKRDELHFLLVNHLCSDWAEETNGITGPEGCANRIIDELENKRLLEWRADELVEATIFGDENSVKLKDLLQILNEPMWTSHLDAAVVFSVGGKTYPIEEAMKIDGFVVFRDLTHESKYKKDEL